MVNRYDMRGNMWPSEDGGIVSYRDYATLKAERDALAAENAGLKSKGRELLGEACAVYAKLNKLIDPTIGDFVDGQTLHEFQFVLDVETPATDRFIAEVKAQGVDLAITNLFCGGVPETRMAFIASMTQFAAQLRKGVQS